MVPVELTLHNFLSYGETPTVLDFTGFRVACMSGENGHGKSAILDAITYALWGEARKGRADRKPDDGLLRLGASEMEVGLTFDLDAGRYRVIRRYRRRPKSSSSELDLQVYDEVGQRYRSLSAGHVTQTQRRITNLLSMDYDTFINSAFVLQGRSDEFTRKGAGQRKQILAEILGLARYERLEDLARAEFKKKTLAREAGELQLKAYREDLGRQEDYESQLAQLKVKQAALETDLTKREGRIEKCQSEWSEAVERRKRLSHASVELAADISRYVELTERRALLVERRQADEKALAISARIEADAQDFRELTVEGKGLAEKAAAHQQLGEERAAIDREIGEARHGLERLLSGLHAERQTLEQTLADVELILSRASAIEADFSRLSEAKRREIAVEANRDRFESLRARQSEERRLIELQKNSLENELSSLGQQSAELADRLRKKPELETLFGQKSSELARTELLSRELERLKTEGANAGAIQGQKEIKLVELEQAETAVREKRHSLETATSADCPLCGNELDESHLRQLLGQLEADEESHRHSRQVEQNWLREASANMAALRVRYHDLGLSCGDVSALRQETAKLSAQLVRLSEDEASQRDIDRRRKELGATLTGRGYCQTQRRDLQILEAEMADLNFDADELGRIRESIQLHAKADAEHELLLHGRAKLGVVGVRVTAIERSAEENRLRIEKHDYATDQRQALKAVIARQMAVAYDRQRHDEVLKKLDELADVPQKHAHIKAARLRLDDETRSIALLDREIDELDANRTRLRNEVELIEGQLAASTVTAPELTRLRDDLAARRYRRDQLLERRGALQAQLDRCRQLRVEADLLEAQLVVDCREAVMYNHLAQAFGKDGIQALLIEATIPEIEKEANAILSRLTDNRIQMSIESLRDLKSGGTRETLDIRISDELGERSYHLFSGGEAFRADFALRIALSKVLARRSGTRLRTLIIDEGFGTQDARGLEYLKEAIQEISADFDKLLVVTHLPELKEAFAVQIEVTKHPEIGSRLEVLGLP